MTPWLEAFSNHLVSCHKAKLQLVNSCTAQVLRERLEDHQYIRVYLVLNGPSDEQVAALSSHCKLTVVQMDSTCSGTNSSHGNWVHLQQDATPQECAEHVYTEAMLQNELNTHQTTLNLELDGKSETSHSPTNVVAMFSKKLDEIHTNLKDVTNNVRSMGESHSAYYNNRCVDNN